MKLFAIYENHNGTMKLKDIRLLSSELTPTNVKYLLFIDEEVRRNIWVTYH